MGALAAQGNVSVVTVFTEAAPRHTLRPVPSCASAACVTRRTSIASGVPRTGPHWSASACDMRTWASATRCSARVNRGRLADLSWAPAAELTHRNPTYRFDIARGRVSREDRRCLPRLCTELSRALGPNPPQTVFCPLGVGRHVDHLLVRAMGVMLFPHAVFYADFPYVLRSGVDEEFIRTRRLQRFTWDGGVNRKTEAIREYRSQVQGLFPNGAIPHKAEIY